MIAGYNKTMSIQQEKDGDTRLASSNSEAALWRRESSEEMVFHPTSIQNSWSCWTNGLNDFVDITLTASHML